jgi:hypothetical protein
MTFSLILLHRHLSTWKPLCLAWMTFCPYLIQSALVRLFTNRATQQRRILIETSKSQSFLRFHRWNGHFCEQSTFYIGIPLFCALSKSTKIWIWSIGIRKIFYSWTITQGHQSFCLKNVVQLLSRKGSPLNTVFTKNVAEVPEQSCSSGWRPGHAFQNLRQGSKMKIDQVLKYLSPGLWIRQNVSTQNLLSAIV